MKLSLGSSVSADQSFQSSVETIVFASLVEIISMNKDRFTQIFPILSLALSSKIALMFTCLIVAALAGVYSLHLSLSIIIFLSVLLSYHLERRHLNTLLFTPLTVLTLYGFLGLGIGSVLMVVGNDEEFDPNLFSMQVAYILAFPFMMVVYPAFIQRFPDFSLPDASIPESQSFYRPLKIIGWFFFFYAFLALLTGVFTGSADRGEAGAFIVENQYGIWTIFVIFSRFSYLSFILVPLLIRESDVVQRYAIYFLLGLYLILAFATGSRGAVLYPILHMLVGYWMFGGSGKLIKQAMIILVALAFFLIPFMSTEGTSGSAKFTEAETASCIGITKTRFKLEKICETMYLGVPITP